MSWLKSVFTGHKFWLFNSGINGILVIIHLITGTSAIVPLIVLWISLATAQILQAIDAKSTV